MIDMQRFSTIRTGVLAGAAGGLTEIAWVAAYAWFTGGDPTVVARGVTTAAGVGALLPAAPAMLGIAVHLTLAVALGVALTFGWRALSKNLGFAVNPYPLMLAALISVWAVNFLVVLPIVSPAFLHLVPYSVSLMSKILFGAAAAEVVRDQAVLTLSPACSADRAS